MIIGSNKDEATFLMQNDIAAFSLDEAALKGRLHDKFGDRADRVYEVYRAARPQATPSDLLMAISTAYTRWTDSLTMAERKVQQGGAPVFMYQYTYESNWPIPGTSATLKAGHATDIGVMFDNTDVHGGIFGTKPDRFTVAKKMSAYWAGFARHGHPLAAGQPEWPAYTLPERATMMIDVQCAVEYDPNKAERLLWQVG